MLFSITRFMKLAFSTTHLFQLLEQFEQQYLPLDLFVHRYFQAHKQLGARDRRTIAHAIYTMYRWRALLDYLSEGKPSWEKRYTLLQGLQPSHYLYANQIPLHVRVSHPEPFVSLLVEEYGEETAIHLCQVGNTEAPVTIRTNLAKTNRESLLKKWHAWEPHPCTYSPWGISFKKRLPLTSLPEFKEGLFDIQDETSQRIAQQVFVQPGAHILDYCAGAGGKALAFAPLMQQQGKLYLHDIRPQSLERAQERARRAGINNIICLPAGDPRLPSLHERMDWVVVDAPCTGSGTWRRHPEEKWRFSLSLLEDYISRQRALVAEALSFVKPGGRLLYATCSLLKKENEAQAAFFLAHHPLEQVGEALSILPEYGEGDGGFAVTFRKRALGR